MQNWWKCNHFPEKENIREASKMPCQNVNCIRITYCILIFPLNIVSFFINFSLFFPVWLLEIGIWRWQYWWLSFKMKLLYLERVMLAGIAYIVTCSTMVHWQSISICLRTTRIKSGHSKNIKKTIKRTGQRFYHLISSLCQDWRNWKTKLRSRSLNVVVSLAYPPGLSVVRP